MGPYSLFFPRILLLLTCAVILCLVLNCLPVSALQVAPGSNCTMLCYGQVSFSNTTTEDITCYDKEYDSTSVGKVFKNCVACEMKSESFNPGTLQTDLGWALCALKQNLLLWLTQLIYIYSQYEIHLGLVYVRLSHIRISCCPSMR